MNSSVEVQENQSSAGAEVLSLLMLLTVRTRGCIGLDRGEIDAHCAGGAGQGRAGCGLEAEAEAVLEAAEGRGAGGG